MELYFSWPQVSWIKQLTTEPSDNWKDLETKSTAEVSVSIIVGSPYIKLINLIKNIFTYVLMRELFPTLL